MDKVEYKTNDLNTIDDALAISLEVFNPTEKEAQEYHNKQDWIKKLGDNGLLITAYVDTLPAGFVLCYIKESGSLHIWVGGVLSKYRGLGLWSGMYKKVEEYAKSKNIHRLTLNTYKDEFPVMYRFAIKNGFKCYKTETTKILEKSYFEKNL